ncbi:hypothetical protein WICPIJ_005817 [Wickerhamomyces pijperi]|uniref:Uncharacterized protein n=1 Tax=Wickerhamomyces pijperi TaxID=599730 RepID=A0A9P8Q5J7_WICPI|nr:hypothetical protein WICPIJ_005817 [Wickerhamomyces pijperi]
MDISQLLTEKRLSIIGDIDAKRTLAADVDFQKELYQLISDPQSVLPSDIIGTRIYREIFRNALLIVNSLSYSRDFDQEGLFQGYMIQFIQDNAENEDKSTAMERDETFKLMLLCLSKLKIREELLTQTFKDYLSYKLVATTDEETIQLILKYLIKLTNLSKPDDYSEFFPQIMHLYSRALTTGCKYCTEVFYLMDNYLEPQRFDANPMYAKEFNKLVRLLKKSIVEKKNLLNISNYLNYAITVHATSTKKTQEIQLKFLKQWVIPLLLNDTEKFHRGTMGKINPILLLKKISLEFPSLNKPLIDADLIDTFIDYLGTVNVSAYISTSEIIRSAESKTIEMNISNIFMIFSSFASKEEANRDSIIRRNNVVVLNIIEEVLRNYMVLKAKHEKKNKSNPELKIKELDHELAISALQLLKSLSRSIVTLRRYLVDLKIPSVLIDLVKPSCSFDAVNVEADEKCSDSEDMDVDSEDSSTEFLDLLRKKTRRENEVISLTLAVLANLILEFSPLRKTFLELGLITIIRLYLEKGSDPEFSSLIDFDIKFNSLCVVKHLVYNEKMKFKEELIVDQISLPVIYAYLKDDIEIPLQDQALNVLKNLTSNCNKLQTYRILQYYQSMELDEVLDHGRLNETCLFFKLLIGKLKDPKYDNKVGAYVHEIRETTIYIFAHFLKSNEKLRNILIDNIELLKIMKDILTSSESPDKLKTAAVWFLINLTWLDSSKAHHVRRNSTNARVPSPIEGNGNGNGNDDEDEVMEDAQDQLPEAAEEPTNGTETDHSVRRLELLNELGFKSILRTLLTDIELKLNNVSTSNLSVDLKNRVKTVLSNLNTDD